MLKNTDIDSKIEPSSERRLTAIQNSTIILNHVQKNYQHIEITELFSPWCAGDWKDDLSAANF